MPEQTFWAVTKSPWTSVSNRYWCAYGVQPPTDKDPLIITCEINPPKSGRNLQCAGLFVRDAAGRIFLAHTGKIGGGFKGVGKAAFLSRCDGANLQEIAWPHGIVSNAIVIGRIDGAGIRRQVGEFVRQVAEFKAWVREKGGAEIKLSLEASYFDEFMGKMRSYRRTGPIESTCNHGFIIRDLRLALVKLGFKNIGKDTPRDLFITKNGRAVMLFEAKTDDGLQCLYTGIGQLMLHGAADTPSPKRVLVLPKSPSKQTARRLHTLGLSVVTYNFDGRATTFQGLREVVDAL